MRRFLLVTLSILNQHASTSVPQATSTDSGTYTTLTGIFQHTSADDHEMLHEIGFELGLQLHQIVTDRALSHQN